MHIMLDLETLGTKPGCVILSVGACVFDPYSHATDCRQFYRNCNVTSQIMKGLSVDPKTVQWWQGQSDAAKEHLNKEPEDFGHVVDWFIGWVLRVQSSVADPVYIWAYSPEFDCAIFKAACEAFGREAPWEFRNQRDVRTWCAAFNYDIKTTPPVGEAHNALDDALFQARAVQMAYAPHRPPMPAMRKGHDPEPLVVHCEECRIAVPCKHETAVYIGNAGTLYCDKCDNHIPAAL